MTCHIIVLRNFLPMLRYMLSSDESNDDSDF